MSPPPISTPSPASLEGARRIVVFAEASAQVPALLFVHYLRHAMLHGDLVTSELDAMIAMHDIGPDDVVVFFALTLTFHATVTVHDFVRARGATTLAITGSPVSPLQLRATHVIVAPAESPTMRFSVVAAVNAVELLFAHIVSRRARHRVRRARHAARNLPDAPSSPRRLRATLLHRRRSGGHDRNDCGGPSTSSG